MSGLGQRIDDGRPMYQPPPKTDRKAKGLRRVSKERAAENRSNDQINENFLFYNPVCACGCGELASTRHHLCSGSFARQASLFDTDVQLPAAEFCNK